MHNADNSKIFKTYEKKIPAAALITIFLTLVILFTVLLNTAVFAKESESDGGYIKDSGNVIVSNNAASGEKDPLQTFLTVTVDKDGASNFTYIHDPADNPAAMRDITADASAIYGFRPSKTGTLKAYADENWSDPELVEKWRQERIAYHVSIETMYDILLQMQNDGNSVEEIARAVSAKRNEIRMDSYKDDPEGLETIKQRNLERYGHEEGPLPDELYAQYGSWETVIDKAFSSNVGMDACLGLYDNYYYLYVILGQVKDDSPSGVYPIVEIAGLRGNGVWTKGSADGVVITVRSSFDGGSDSFCAVSTDGIELVRDLDYTVSGGGTVIALTSDTLEKLNSGRHTVTIRYDNGFAHTVLTIQSANEDGPSSPQTGDNTLALITLSFICALLLSAAFNNDRKRFRYI